MLLLNIKHCVSGHDIIQSDFLVYVLKCLISILLVYIALSKMLDVVALNIKHCASGHDIIQSDFFVAAFH